MVPWSMPKCRNFMRNLSYAAQMSCDVATLPFQAHANYGTWSMDFEPIKKKKFTGFLDLKFFLVSLECM